MRRMRKKHPSIIDRIWVIEMKSQSIDNVIILAVLDAIMEPTFTMLTAAEHMWVQDLDDFVDADLARRVWQTMIRAKRDELKD